jgi:glycosyltransferase involved in cell wall biosynthesis
MSEATRVTYIWIFSENDGRLEETLATYVRHIRGIPGRADLVLVSNGVDEQVSPGLIRVLEQSGLPASILRLHREGGEAAALSAAFRHAQGDLVVVLPSYLQVDPQEIARLVAALSQDGTDYVASFRSPRIDAKSGRTKSALFNWLTRRATGVPLHDLNSGLRGMRRAVIEEVPVYGDLFRFLPILASMQGFRVREVTVRHIEERVAKGDYRFGVYLRRMLDLLTLFFLIKFTRKPLRFFGMLGSAVFGIGAITLVYLVIERMLGRTLADRPLLIYGILMFVLGVQLFSIGLLGELIIFTYARDTSEYQVEKVYESTRS